MTFVELLRELTQRSSMPEPMKADAEKLLTELKEVNAFGTTIAGFQTEAHQFITDWSFANYTRCKYCGKTKEEHVDE